MVEFSKLKMFKKQNEPSFLKIRSFFKSKLGKNCIDIHFPFRLYIK